MPRLWTKPVSSLTIASSKRSSAGGSWIPMAALAGNAPAPHIAIPSAHPAATLTRPPMLTSAWKRPETGCFAPPLIRPQIVYGGDRCGIYSYLSAVIGSMRTARRAGCRSTDRGLRSRLT